MAVRMKNIRIVRRLMFFGHDYIYPNDKKGKLGKMLDKRADELIKSAIFVLAILLFAALIYILYPMYTVVAEGARPFPVPVFFPFLDPETKIGYYLNILNQAIMSVITLCGNLAIEVCVTLLVNNLWAAADVIQHHLDEVQVGIKSGESNAVRNARIRNILVQIQDLDM